MNLSVIALAVLAWKLFSDRQTREKDSHQPKIAITDFLNDEMKTVIQGAEMLTNKNATNDERMSAIIGLMSNPTVMSFAEGFFGKRNEEKQETQEEQGRGEQSFSNEEGYEFERPSQASQEFFRPIEKIADPEVKSKLYWFYDNWYL